MPDGLTIQPREALGIASVMARRCTGREQISAMLGIDLPAGQSAVFAGNRTALGTGPGTWLLIEEGAAADFAQSVRQRLAGVASVSDQSSGYAVMRLSGPNARTLLQRGAAIDLHPEAFDAGSAATTVIGHIGVIMWQVDERPAFDIATFRSYGASFRHWLQQAAAAVEG